MSKKRITYILSHYPQISETYIKSELEAVKEDYEIQIIGIRPVDTPYRNHLPYQQIAKPDLILKAINEFSPDLLHSHWLTNTRTVAYFAGHFNPERRQIPFTIRAHSFDVLESTGKNILDAAPFINSSLCLGVINFPFTRKLLEKGGIHSLKIHDCFPVVNIKQFYDRSPNGNGVLSVTSALPKKKLEDFLELALQMPDKPFNLYCYGGYNAKKIENLNHQMGNPVQIKPPIEPDLMKIEFKKHEWLVYTGSKEANLIGWPIAIAEAQAAGVGVCVPNLRPDLREYIGEAGFLYDSISEVPEIISKPYPQEMREKGFEQARKSDILKHKKILTDLWRQENNDQTVNYISNTKVDETVTPWGEGSSVFERRYRTDQNLKQLVQTIKHLEKIIPAESVLAVADSPFSLGVEIQLYFPSFNIKPFPERDGVFWSAPWDNESAISELKLLEHTEASYLVMCWYSFWWLEHFPQFHKYLNDRYKCVLKTKVMIVWKVK